MPKVIAVSWKAGMVPLALGTQTAGSVNRPAAYTGTGAFKPSTLSIGGVGIVPLSPSFDTLGAFGQTAQDAAWLAAGYAADHLGLKSPPAIAPRLVVLQDPLIARLTQPGTAAQVEALAADMVPAAHCTGCWQAPPHELPAGQAQHDLHVQPLMPMSLPSPQNVGPLHEEPHVSGWQPVVAPE